MRQQSMFFTARVGEKLADVRLQANLRKVKDNFVDIFAAAKHDYNQESDFEVLRDAGAAIRKRVLDKLDIWLELFEQNATARGASVLWARDGREVCEHVMNIARQHGVSKAVKTKSMLSEEVDLNTALSAAGIQAVETDLGEYILQIAAMKRLRTSSHQPCTRTSTRWPICSPKHTTRRARPGFLNSRARRARC